MTDERFNDEHHWTRAAKLWSRLMECRAPAQVGWYGLQSLGDGWRPVTPDENAPSH